MTEFAGGVSRLSQLSFPLDVAGGEPISTLGDALDLCSGLSQESRAKSHWKVAIKMLDLALQEPGYMNSATMSLQTALLLDGRLRRTGPDPGNTD